MYKSKNEIQQSVKQGAFSQEFKHFESVVY